MICKNCMKQLPDDILYCPACGSKQESVQAVSIPYAPQPKPEVKTGFTQAMVFSILSLVLGGGISLITGVIALVYAAISKTRLEEGNYERACKDASVSRTLNIVTIVLFSLRVVLLILIIVLYAALFAVALQEMPMY